MADAVRACAQRALRGHVVRVLGWAAHDRLDAVDAVSTLDPLVQVGECLRDISPENTAYGVVRSVQSILPSATGQGCGESSPQLAIKKLNKKATRK